MALWLHGAMTVGELARRLDLPAHALTPMVRRLQHAGLLTRRRHHHDGRSVTLALTAAGRDLEAAASDAQHRVVCHRPDR